MFTTPRVILVRRFTQLLVGLMLYGFAISLMYEAAIGVAPWEVLTQGIANQTGLPFGLLTNVIGALVLLLWIPIRQKPGIGTVANVLIIGTFAQIGLGLIATPSALWQQALLFAGGLVLLAVATGLYIGARFGPGPRDGLMTGIHARWGFRLWIVRTVIEVSVLSVGWLLGGNVGVGTVLFAVLIGPMVNLTVPWLRVPQPAAAPAPALPASDPQPPAQAAATPATPAVS